MRWVARAVLGAVVAAAMAGCDDVQADYCDALRQAIADNIRIDPSQDQLDAIRDAISSGRRVADVAPDEVRDDWGVLLTTFEQAVDRGSWDTLSTHELKRYDRAARTAAAHGRQVCGLTEDDVL